MARSGRASRVSSSGKGRGNGMAFYQRLVLRFMVAVGIAMFVQVMTASAQPLQLAGYSQPDGAITLFLHGDRIDPYFANKALLSAAEAGADVAAAARAWIGWLLSRQRANGTFGRYCRDNGVFVECAEADADDALMATWIELLVRFAPPGGMPPEWTASIARASAELSNLRDRNTGVYHISHALPVALLMDNVEVISAFEALARWHAARGEPDQAGQWRGRAQALAGHVRKVFRMAGGGYRASTQRTSDRDFYPARVAQLFPLLGGLEDTDRTGYFGAWLKKNGADWFAQAKHDYPWGLAALAAYKAGDLKTVACWRAHAAPFRHGRHWNVLEEALFQALGATEAAATAIDCHVGDRS